MADLFDSMPPPSPAPKPKADLAPKRCDRPNNGAHVCRAGGGAGYYSEDGGKTWFCTNHRPSDFFAKDRK